ncbi:hypothetical protein KIN20_036475 [Parelaphostrongylus tenuis]|uniref:Uncharacterized protein n=1 Tax=Parelaphostrongylus tenuis TaxID=148309 RepID=A0AAD5RD23_PARTN|nr:hypothetical protein KIN20_036475 [Parelaphostrongylus tenuis]
MTQDSDDLLDLVFAGPINLPTIKVKHDSEMSAVPPTPTESEHSTIHYEVNRRSESSYLNDSQFDSDGILENHDQRCNAVNYDYSALSTPTSVSVRSSVSQKHQYESGKEDMTGLEPYTYTKSESYSDGNELATTNVTSSEHDSEGTHMPVDNDDEVAFETLEYHDGRGTNESQLHHDTHHDRHEKNKEAKVDDTTHKVAESKEETPTLRSVDVSESEEYHSSRRLVESTEIYDPYESTTKTHIEQHEEKEMVPNKLGPNVRDVMRSVLLNEEPHFTNDQTEVLKKQNKLKQELVWSEKSDQRSVSSLDRNKFGSYDEIHIRTPKHLSPSSTLVRQTQRHVEDLPFRIGAVKQNCQRIEMSRNREDSLEYIIHKETHIFENMGGNGTYDCNETMAPVIKEQHSQEHGLIRDQCGYSQETRWKKCQLEHKNHVDSDDESGQRRVVGDHARHYKHDNYNVRSHNSSGDTTSDYQFHSYAQHEQHEHQDHHVENIEPYVAAHEECSKELNKSYYYERDNINEVDTTQLPVLELISKFEGSLKHRKSGSHESGKIRISTNYCDDVVQLHHKPDVDVGHKPQSFSVYRYEGVRSSSVSRSVKVRALHKPDTTGGHRFQNSPIRRTEDVLSLNKPDAREDQRSQKSSIHHSKDVQPHYKPDTRRNWRSQNSFVHRTEDIHSLYKPAVRDDHRFQISLSQCSEDVQPHYEPYARGERRSQNSSNNRTEEAVVKDIVVEMELQKPPIYTKEPQPRITPRFNHKSAIKQKVTPTPVRRLPHIPKPPNTDMLPSMGVVRNMRDFFTIQEQKEDFITPKTQLKVSPPLSRQSRPVKTILETRQFPPSSKRSTHHGTQQAFKGEPKQMANIKSDSEPYHNHHHCCCCAHHHCSQMQQQGLPQQSYLSVQSTSVVDSRKRTARTLQRDIDPGSQYHHIDHERNDDSEKPFVLTTVEQRRAIYEQMLKN